MLKLADLVDQHKETLATIETWDNGMLFRGIDNCKF
jgi:acyl-CoA reductase-like NAD-dependent aldehyde dehydrogenase